MIKEHNKEEYNWMVGEIKTKFTCDECEIPSNENLKLPEFVSKIDPKYHNLGGGKHV